MKIGMLFPGYGNQFVGMGKELYDEVRLIQEYFEQACYCLDTNFVKLCFASSDIELKKLNNAYTSLYLVSLSIAEYIKSQNINIDLVAGHGIGEYAALSYAQGLSLPDGLYLLNKLASFYNDIKESLNFKSFLIFETDREKIDTVYNKHKDKYPDSQVYIAIHNNESSYIVSGKDLDIELFVKLARKERIGRVKKYAFSSGLHTPILKDLEKKLRIYLTKVDFKDLTIPLVNNVDAKSIYKAKDIEDALMRQISSALYWNDVIKSFSHIDVILIPSPNKTFYKEVAAYYPNKLVIPINKLEDIDKINKLVI